MVVVSVTNILLFST